MQERRRSFGSTVYYIVGEARPTRLLSRFYSLYYKAETWLDADTLLPQRGSIYSEEGRRRRLKVTRFDQAAHRAEHEIRRATVVRNTITVPPSVQDGLSVLYALRAMPLKPGDRVRIPVSDSGKVYTVHLAVDRTETLETGVGAVQALRISAQIIEEGAGPTDRRISLWISDDARHLPVRVQVDLLVGSFVLTLRHAQ